MMKEKYDFNDLLEIMRRLRGKNGCPWDREQSHESLKRYFIEETYEVLEAIDLKDNKKICEELGDALLQVVFHAQIADENGNFNINDVIDGISRKMVMRHRHVFGDASADTAEDVLSLWEEIKKEEKGAKTVTHVLKDIPSNLPALMRSYKVQGKAADVGFDWDNISDVYKKVYEEIKELEEAEKEGDKAHIEEELGDLLFAVVNLSRFLKVHPELALTATINKFIKRFEYVEERSMQKGKELKNMTLKEMDELWDEAKEMEGKL